MNEHETLVATVGEWWADPTLHELHRLPARALTTAYRSADDARAAKRPWELSLDGDWGFTLVDHPNQTPDGWTKAPIRKRSQVEVPGNWTMQDTGDKPHYTNYVMPWKGDPPSVPDHNPTGLYRRDFEIPRGWTKRQTILQLGAVETKAAVWCNGHLIGICSDSRLPSEFDLTESLKDGTNKLAVMVVRYAAETWIEDQDHWWHGGIHRSVSLISRGKSHLADVVATPAATGDGDKWRLDVTSKVGGSYAGYRVAAQLETLGGRAIKNGSTEAQVSEFDDSSHLAAMVDAYRHPGAIAASSVTVSGIETWSHESPKLYRVLVSLIDPRGRTVEVAPIIVGFRQVKIDGAELLLNGAPLLIAGVNRHDHHPTKGKVMSPEELRADAANIKRCGFNAVRTAHYPPDTALLDACDEIGLWVICEANVESHARWQEVVHDPIFEMAFVDRVKRMVTFHRNHPSIMGWSLGNEAGHGPAHNAAAAWVRATDPSRFVQYEGGVMDWWRGDDRADFAPNSTDIDCPMYPPFARVADAISRGFPKPVIMCEYSHAMGNSNGNLADYWELIENNHGLQGGFVWDWKDQGLVTHDDDGNEYLGYGGCFGNEPNDAAFCCNGVVDAWGNPHPGIEEHRHLTQPVRSLLINNGGSARLRITNRRAFRDLSDLTGQAVLEVDGEPVWSTYLNIAKIAPGNHKDVSIRLPKRRRGKEAFLTVQFTTSSKTQWAPRGHLVAWNQHRVSAASVAPRTERLGLTTSEDDTTVSATVGTMSISFEKATGQVASLRRGRTEVLAEPPRLSLWRAPTDNDGVLVGPAARVAGPVVGWLAVGLDELHVGKPKVTIRRTNGFLLVTTDTVVSTGAGNKIKHTQMVRVNPYGGVRFHEEVAIPKSIPDLPRVGIEFALDGSLDRLTWYGPGPVDTYEDRTAAPVGKWSSTVAEQYHAFATPQHHGSHRQTRWAELTNGRGNGVHIRLNGFSFDVSQYRASALTAATIPPELEPSGLIHVHIDGAHRGVGTAACGPDTTQTVGPGTYEFGWDIMPTD